MTPQPYRSIVVVDYDPAWPMVFEEVRAKLTKLLGNIVNEVAHVGSTSVPGLSAKPKIDVDVILESDAQIPLASSRLQAAGYTAHGNKYNDGMWAFTLGRGSFGERVYLCALGNETHHKRLIFRDHLRNHPDDAAAYAALKKRLASETDHDWEYYTGSKRPFVDEILRKAAKISRSAQHGDL